MTASSACAMMRAVTRRPTSISIVFALLIGAALTAPARAAETYKVGIKQIEFADSHYGDRKLAVVMFYPAVVDDKATPFSLPYFINLDLYKDAPLAPSDEQAPAGDAVARTRLEPAAICLVRREPCRAWLYRRRALSLPGQHL